MQIDAADQRTREREDQLSLKESEFDRKLKGLEERFLSRRDRTEQREMADIKQNYSVEIELLQH